MSADIVLSSDSEVDGRPIVLSSRSSSPLAVEQAPYRASSPELVGLQEATTSAPPSRQPSPPPSRSPSPPALAPNLFRPAARKSAQGVRPGSGRPTAARVRATRVKKEEDDDGGGRGLGAARRPGIGMTPKVEEDEKWLHEKRKGRKEELPLNDLPYPFEISVRLEEIRLTLKSQSSPNLSASVAFRTLETPARDAVSAQKHTISLNPSMECYDRLSAASPSRLASPHLPETTPSRPSPRTFDIFDSPLSDQQAPHDIVLLLSLQDPASSAPNDPPPTTYTGHLSLTKGGKLRPSGEGTVKLKHQEQRVLRAGSKPPPLPQTRASDNRQDGPAPVGGEVSVSWTVEVHAGPDEWVDVELAGKGDAVEGGEAKGRVGDEEMREILEAELRKQEREWREEVVERHEFYADLETAYPPTKPPSLDVDPSAPTPSSLIPELDGPVPPSEPFSPPPRFLPVPSYTHTSFHPRALPLDRGPISTFPQFRTAQDDAEHWYAVKQIFDYLLTYQEEDEAEGREVGEATKDAAAAEEEEEPWMVRAWVQHEALTPPDVGRVHRDFLALRSLFNTLSIPPAHLASLESAARADAVAREKFFNPDEGAFALENFGSAEAAKEVTRAFALFEQRTGVTAWMANERWKQTGGVPLFSLPAQPEPCEFCGTVFCTLHGDPSDALRSYNVPTKPKARSSPKPEKCPFCNHAGCLNVVKPRHNEPLPVLDQLAAQIKAGEIPPLDPCMASRLVGHPVAEDDVFVYPPPSPPFKPNAFKLRKLLPGMSTGYEPCNCQGGSCDGDACTCSTRRTFCDRFCGCPPSCRRRFPGCKDSNCSDCICKQQNRECDPHICGCASDTCRNSSIRLGREKLVQVVESKIPGAGYGVILLESAADDDLIGAYGGEHFNFGADVDAPIGPRWAKVLLDGEIMSYWFDVDGVGKDDEEGHVVDSRIYGSTMRSINGVAKAALANVEVKIRYVQGTHQIGIYASRDLPAGTELLMDYGKNYTNEWAEKSAA
ncbi:hypothetical protein JCM8097_009561 [Rhodosporidiobolus ruineniae]